VISLGIDYVAFATILEPRRSSRTSDLEQRRDDEANYRRYQHDHGCMDQEGPRFAPAYWTKPSQRRRRDKEDEDRCYCENLTQNPVGRWTEIRKSCDVEKTRHKPHPRSSTSLVLPIEFI
jgi:hypothetical protein